MYFKEEMFPFLKQECRNSAYRTGTPKQRKFKLLSKKDTNK